VADHHGAQRERAVRGHEGVQPRMFIGKDRPAMGTDRTYQLWTPEGKRAIPGNVVPGGASPAPATDPPKACERVAFQSLPTVAISRIEVLS
jgi:hypothetical protein